MMFDFSRLKTDKPLHYPYRTIVDANPDDYYWHRDTGFYKLWIQDHMPRAEFDIGAAESAYDAVVAFKRQSDLFLFELAKPALAQLVEWGYNKHVSN